MFKSNRFALLIVLALLLGMLTVSVGAQDRVEIRWYVGLGAGTDAPQIEAQEQIVADFNESQDEIELVLEIVDNDSAYDVLNTQIAAGNAPDIIGPTGVRGFSAFPNALLDLSDLIEENEYDLSDFDPALVEFWNIDGVQVGLPFAVFPSFIFVNLDLFDEAGLNYPPQVYGEPYIMPDGTEVEWSLDTVREIGMILTVDANGFDATMDEFDPNNIVQFGFGNVFTDLRGRLAMFGGGNFVNDDGEAYMPEQWVEGVNWLQSAIWEDYFYPSGPYGGSDILNAGNWFESGNLGMAHVHLWYATCCLFGLDANWDIAVMPSYNGVTTAKLHADTFGILNSTEHPQEAFTVLTYLLGSRANDLNTLYGGFPARISLQGDYFANLDTVEPFVNQDINWQVAVDSLAFPDSPNHEAGMPGVLEATDRYNAFTQELDNNPDFDVAAGIDELVADLQTIFDNAE